MTNQTPNPAPAPGAVSRAWRAMGSLRLGVVLLIVVAAASTVGVILPQPESFSARSYAEKRLDAQSEEALKPKEFLDLAQAAGVLPVEGAAPAEDWDAYYARAVGEARAGTLADRDWASFLAALGQQIQGGKLEDLGLRLAYVDSYGTLIGRVLLAAQVHRSFTSLWFRALCLLLLVSLVACSSRRLPAEWRAAFRTRAHTSPDWYRGHSEHAAAVLGPCDDEVARELGAAFGEHGVAIRTSGIDKAAEAVERALRSAGFCVHRRRGTGHAAFTASRGWLGGLGRVWWPLGALAGAGRLGSQVVHLGVILVLIGGFVSGRVSFRHPQLLAAGDVVAVPDVGYRLSLGYQLKQVYRDVLGFFGRDVRFEPSAAEKAAMADDWRELPGAPAREAVFRLRLRRLDVAIDPRGKPEYYGAHVTLLDSDPPVADVIEVNRPLIYRGFHAYQQSYQPDYRQITSVSFVVAKVRRGTGAAASPHGAEAPMAIEQQVSVAAQPGAEVAVPGTGLTLCILRYFPHWTMPLEQTPDGRTVRGAVRNASDEALNPAIEVRFETHGLEPFTRWVMLPFRPGEPRQGGIADYGDYRVMPVDFTPDYATWLTFKTHPVMLPVWIGCGAMMLGIVLCFYCNHERIWALVRAGSDGACEVLLAGNSFKWRERFHERFRALVASLESERGSKT